MKNLVIPLLFLSFSLQAQNLSVIDRGYFFGRDYYILRSGNAKMVVQCDKADFGAAFTYLLFNASEPNQSVQKEKSFNYIQQKGFVSSALTVIMRNFRFTALGLTLNTRWRIESSIPSVEADWWASGVKVRELITPVSLNGVFKRTITLESADLVTDDTVSMELSLPVPASVIKGNVLICQNANASIALFISGNEQVTVSSSKESLEIGPIPLKPGEKKVIESYLFLQIPANQDDLYTRISTMDQWIDRESKAEADKWKNSNTLITKDSIVQNISDNCRFILPGYISDMGKMDAGIFEYGNQWVRDGSNTALGLIHIGEFELARAMFEHMLKDMINDNGTTMVDGIFDDPDGEEFDQMGEIMHAMKSYVDWTGDFSLLKEYSGKIVNMIERPLRPEFRDATGMLHNRRDFWERTFNDAYELAYQTWLIEGLRDAADLSEYINSEKKASYWRAEADKTLQSMLYHPTLKLVDNGHLIKRRSTSGEVVDQVKYKGWVYGAPGQVERLSRLMPDASMALPISLDIVDPNSVLAKNTLKELEKLWNERWSFGGYDRYNTSSQADQPGPWSFSTTFIMRAQHEAGQFDMSRRSLEWLYNNPEGHTGAWFEEIPIISAQAPMCGLLPWTTAEVSYFIVHHMMGIKFKSGQMIIKPALYEITSPLKSDLRFRKSRFTLEINGYGHATYAIINNKKINANQNGEIIVPLDFAGGSIQIFYN